MVITVSVSCPMQDFGINDDEPSVSAVSVKTPTYILCMQKRQ